LRIQFLRSQKYLLTRSRITTRFGPSGRSARLRWYELCTRSPGTGSPGTGPADSGDRFHHQPLTRVADLLDPHTDPGKQHIFDRLEGSHGATQRRNDHAFHSLTWGFTQLQTEPLSDSAINSTGVAGFGTPIQSERSATAAGTAPVSLPVGQELAARAGGGVARSRADVVVYAAS
jgi:hypothetical protein